MRRSLGFTLIEVLVALLVFGLIASSAAQVGSQYIGTFEKIRDKTMAAWIADNRLNEIRLEDQLPEVSENSDDFDYGPFRWRVTTKVLETEEETMRRVEVDVAVYRGANNETHNIHSLAGFVGE